MTSSMTDPAPAPTPTVDDQVKTICRAYRAVFAGSKPHVTMGFFEKTEKEPEAFTALVADSGSSSNPAVQGQGETTEAALLAVMSHLAKLMHKLEWDAQKRLEEATERHRTWSSKVFEAALSLEPGP